MKKVIGTNLFCDISYKKMLHRCMEGVAPTQKCPLPKSPRSWVGVALTSKSDKFRQSSEGVAQTNFQNAVKFSKFPFVRRSWKGGGSGMQLGGDGSDIISYPQIFLKYLRRCREGGGLTPTLYYTSMGYPLSFLRSQQSFVPSSRVGLFSPKLTLDPRW